MEVSSSKGKKAVTNYKTIEIFENKKIPTLSLVECKLETGRTHQIRVHMNHKGNSLVGDDKYNCLLYTSPSPRDKRQSRMPSSA